MRSTTRVEGGDVLAGAGVIGASNILGQLEAAGHAGDARDDQARAAGRP